MGPSRANEKGSERRSSLACQLNDDFPVLDMTSQHSTIKMLARDNRRAGKKKEVCAIRLTACSFKPMEAKRIAISRKKNF